ncbi:hypothetical protein O1611_g1632 [Lasiodiplodia mahajangana]|uniref:Uncharacterized protein n=1 Tax=Lasiodiplodia mahajangana TaxID=1108764 RepID=A0ACC2JWT6_9PEZI|nr:hypothetical protein O1611_g1632 [Lasiodiplodia mahajangana]
MVPPKPVNGALIPATASQSSSPHPTCEDAQDGQASVQAITGQPPAARAQPRAFDTSAVLTPQTTLPGGHSSTTQKMLFSDLYKSTKLPLSRLRQHSQQQQPIPVSREYDPDLVSKDKAKQREAVRRFLAERIRNDWVFNWPPVSIVEDVKKQDQDSNEEIESSSVQQPVISEARKTDEAAPGADDDGYHCDDNEEDEDDDVASVYSTVSDNPVHFCPRAEWLSDLSDDENDELASPLAYRFETPDAVGSTVKAIELARSAKRRRAARAEMEWNHGLACFTARRDAWTGAKTVRVRPKPAESTPTSPTTRRLSFWRLSSSSSPSSPTDSPTGSTVGAAPLSPSGTRTSGDTTALSSVDSEPKELKAKQNSSQYPVQILLPIPPPLLPPANPMRASITPASYAAIYDKIIVHALTPACPINLADVLRSCVVGWKRDGEWPPRPVEVPAVAAVRKKKRKDSNTEKRASIGRRLSFNLLGRRLSGGSDPNSAPASPATKQDDAGAARGMKKSLQRVLGLGQDT